LVNVVNIHGEAPKNGMKPRFKRRGARNDFNERCCELNAHAADALRAYEADVWVRTLQL